MEITVSICSTDSKQISGMNNIKLQNQRIFRIYVMLGISLYGKHSGVVLDEIA